MCKAIKEQLRKITSLLLVAVMIFSMDMGYFVFDVGATEAVSENDMDVEVETEAEAETEEDEGFETFTNHALIRSLYDAYGDMESVELMYAGGNTSAPNYGKIAKSELAKITELYLGVYAISFGNRHRAYIYGSDFRELNKLTNLQTLVISAGSGSTVADDTRTKIEQVSFPNSLKNLKLDCSIINCQIDISNCTKLESFSITDCTLQYPNIVGLSSGNATIHGLKNILLHGSNVESIVLPADDVTSPGLTFSAVSVPELKTINFGGYKITDDCILSNTNIQSLTINGVVNKEDQILDISGCNDLNSLTLNYKFNGNYILTVNANDIEKSTGTCNITKTGVTSGKYKMMGYSGSYLIHYAQNDSSIFDIEDQGTLTYPDLVVFKQDRWHFDFLEKWINNKTPYRRDFSANPVFLRINEKIEDNSVYFYKTDCGYVNRDINYTTEISPDDGVIIADTKENKHKITALKPGVADFIIKNSDGNQIGSGSAQRIIVFPRITDMSMTTGTVSIKPGETKEFSTTMTVYNDDKEVLNTIRDYKDKSGSSAYILNYMGFIGWDVYKKSGDTWVPFAGYTNAGITIKYSSGDSTSRTVSDGKITDTHKLVIGDNLPTGEYQIRATVRDNTKIDAYGNPMAPSNDNYIKTEESNSYTFKINNVTQTSNKLCYGYNGGADTSVIFESPDLGTGYEYSAKILNTSDNFDNCLVLEPAESGIDYKQKLTFNSAKTDAEIATFLKSIQSGDDCKVTVSMTVENSSINYSETYNKVVNLSGFFTAAYDPNGGTLSGSNPSYYEIPTASENSSNLMLKNPTNEGYDFKGWYSGTTKVTKLGEGVLGNISLKAEWEKKETPQNPVTPTDPVTPQDPVKPQDPVTPQNPEKPQDPTEPTKVTKEQATSFVSRMYNDALSRDAENDGLNYWVNQLVEQKVDGAGLAKGFICSKEFTEKNLNNEEYVKVLYETFFGRSADADGLKHWVNALDSGKPRTEVLAGFVNSKEFTNACDASGIVRGTMEPDGSSIYNPGVNGFVNRLYKEALDRKGETMGVEYWSYGINKKQFSPEEAAKRFFLSEEYVKKNVSDEEYVETLYGTFMGRTSDAEGKAYWLNELKSGKTRESVLEGFSRSREFSGIMAEFGL